jgi:hypothetical protein
MEDVLPSAANFGLFIGAALVLLLIPGPAVLYIIGRSVEQGRLAGFVSDVGIHTATLVHVLAAALGLSALLMSSALAFSVAAPAMIGRLFSDSFQSQFLKRSVPLLANSEQISL